MKRKSKCEEDIRQSDEAVQRLSAEYEQLTQDAAALNYGLEQVFPVSCTLLRCTLKARDELSTMSSNNYFAEMSSGSEAGLYLRRIDFCITQL